MDIAADTVGSTRLLIQRSLAAFGWLGGLLGAIWVFGFALTFPLFTLLYLRLVMRRDLEGTGPGG